MRFTANSILGSDKVTIGLITPTLGGTIAHEAHGNLGRELVKLANERLEQIEAAEREVTSG